MCEAPGNPRPKSVRALQCREFLSLRKDSPKALFPRRSSSGAASQSEMTAEDLVDIAAENYVEAADLSEMIARVTRECEE